ncbi:unnamed protein product [Vitrella brassicaformis CCMP3155]|uniref:Uncharacterized protein n=1 Tax=Vitrella brassicaformis (strain CCMP3155) TaxID=1169540 RepID=A0A0G4FGK9_VITBC|nr:unnamed protein product [Vitrella brassicaformis CCMP3155]|eukprot:CEM12618.1 unnamed protein product [Vitrella brassicaformis CCMP3155]
MMQQGGGGHGGPGPSGGGPGGVGGPSPPAGCVPGYYVNRHFIPHGLRKYAVVDLRVLRPVVRSSILVRQCHHEISVFVSPLQDRPDMATMQILKEDRTRFVYYLPDGSLIPAPGLPVVGMYHHQGAPNSAGHALNQAAAASAGGGGGAAQGNSAGHGLNQQAAAAAPNGGGNAPRGSTDNDNNNNNKRTTRKSPPSAVRETKEGFPLQTHQHC